MDSTWSETKSFTSTATVLADLRRRQMTVAPSNVPVNISLKAKHAIVRLIQSASFKTFRYMHPHAYALESAKQQLWLL